jgi:hypothetical protein
MLIHRNLIRGLTDEHAAEQLWDMYPDALRIVVIFFRDLPNVDENLYEYNVWEE